jgi:hypothetical protein
MIHTKSNIINVCRPYKGKSFVDGEGNSYMSYLTNYGQKQVHK